MKKRIYCIVTILFLIISSTYYYTKRNGFDGEEYYNEQGIVLSFSRMNTSKEYTIDLEKGQVLLVESSLSKGELSLLIYCRSNKLYQSNDLNTAAFQLVANYTGTYTIEVEGKKAEGSLSILIQ